MSFDPQSASLLTDAPLASGLTYQVRSDQPRLTEKDAQVVPAKDQRPVDLKTKGINQFALYPRSHAKGSKACFQNLAPDLNRVSTGAGP